MKKPYKSLLEIKIYELSGQDIAEIKAKRIESNRYYDKYLPDYCVRNDNGKIVDSEYFLQFVDEHSSDDQLEEKFLLFNFTTTDEILKEEISGCGIEKILEDIDLRPYFKELKILNKQSILEFHLSSSQYLIIGINYVISGSWEYTEWESEYSLDGVLTDNLNLIEVATAV